MKHLRTHILMLSVAVVTALSVAVGVNTDGAAPEPEQPEFQAAELDIEPAPLPAVVDPAVRDEALAWQPDITATEVEAHARGLAAAVAAAEQERQERERERQAAAERERQEQEREQQAPAAPSGSIWDRLAQCESGGNWGSTVGTYEGGLQFHPGTWDAHKPSGYPEAAYQASRSQQIQVAERVLASQGWGAWPACSRKLGLR